MPHDSRTGKRRGTRLWRLGQVADLIGCCERTIERAIKAGQIKIRQARGRRSNAEYLISEAAVRRFAGVGPDEDLEMPPRRTRRQRREANRRPP